MTYSSKLSSHYLELAEQPISKDVFAGEDVRFSSEYEALENELGKALSLHENGQTDWLKILENSEALLRAQSKDLRVAAWLTWALYQRESFPGLLAGLGLLERLCSRHWVEIHPLKARTRAAAIGWLVPRLEQALNENVPIKEQLPLFRRLAEHLEKLDTALTAQLGDDAPLLLPISRRLSGMLQRGTRRTLIRVLETALRLAHPFMPFITEEIWQRIKGQAGKEGPTLMLQPWPVADEGRIDAAAEGDIEWVKALMLGVRQIRGEMNISMAKRIDIILRNASPSDHRRLADNEPLLMKLAKLESIRVLEAGEEAPMSATALVGDMEVLVPMAGLIDKSAELGRLDKEIQRLEGEVKRVGGKLSNEGFVAKAPADVIDKERAKLAEAEQALAKLAEQRQKIAAL